MLDDIRDSCTLVLDSGDQFFGSVYFSYFGTEPLIKMMEFMSYDVLSLGNHEFDLGTAELLNYLSQVKKDYVCTTLDLESSCLKGMTKKSIVKTLTGCGDGGETIRVGILGAIDISVVNQSSQDEGVKGLDVVEELNKEAELLKTGPEPVDIVIVLSHLGIGVDYSTAEKLKNVDIILGGHSHVLYTQRTEYNGLVDNLDDSYYEGYNSESQGPAPLAVKTESGTPEYIPIVHSGCYGEYITHLVAYVDKDKKSLDVDRLIRGTMDSSTYAKIYDLEKSVINFAHPLATEDYMGENEDAKVALAALKEEVDLELGEELATTKYDLVGDVVTCSLQETNVGDIVADAYRLAEDNVNLAIVNAGGIRGGAKKPQIKYQDVYVMLPYGNEVYSCDISGSIIKDIFEGGLADTQDTLEGKERTSFLQFSGARLFYDMDRPSGDRVTSVDICKNPTTSSTKVNDRLKACDPHNESNWEPVDVNKTYKLVASIYLLEGGDGQAILRDNVRNKVGIGNEDDLLTKFMSDVGHFTMKPEGEGRHNTEPPKDNTVVIAVSVVVSVVVVGVIIGLVVFFCRKKKKGSVSKNNNSPIENRDLNLIAVE